MSPMTMTDYFAERALLALLSPPPSPQAEYRMLEGSGTVLHDSGEGAYDGTFGDVLGAAYYPAWVSDGISFSGTKTVGLPAGAVAGAGSVVFAITPSLSNQANAMAVLSANGTDGANNFGLRSGSGCPLWWANDTYGSVQRMSGQPIYGGTFVLVCDLDGRLFVNGAEVPWYAVSAHGVPPYLGLGGITAARVGLYFTSAYTPFQGRLHWLATYPQPLGPGNAAVVSSNVAAALAARGRAVGAVYKTADVLVIALGDSMTLGYLAASPNLAWSQRGLAGLATPIDYANFAIGGDGSPDVLAHLPQQVYPLLAATTHTRKVVLNFSGTNNDWNTSQADATAIYAGLKAHGATDVLGVTGLPRYADDGPRATYNAWLRTAGGVAWDYLVDWGGDATVGAPGGYSNATNYPDGLHPSTSNHAVGGTYLAGALAAAGIA